MIDPLRDCPHGHQLGKCDSCELIVAEKRIAELVRENKRAHKIAGCTKDNCNSNGFECTGDEKADYEKTLAIITPHTLSTKPSVFTARIRSKGND